MPRVDVKRLPSTQLNGFSGNFGVRASADDFGAAQARGLGAAAQAVNQIGGVLQQQQQAAADLKQERDNADLKVAEGTLLEAYKANSIEHKALAGKDAADGNPAYKENLKKSYQTVRESLPQHLHDKFGVLTHGTSGRYRSVGLEHSYMQGELYADKASASTIEVAMEDAAANYTDQSAIFENLDSIQYEVMEGRAGRGLDQTGKEKLLDDKVSEFHAGIVGRMMDGGDIKSAESYYHLNKGSMDGMTQGSIEAKLNPSITLSNAQAAADNIMLQNPKSASEATQMTKDLPAEERQKANAILRQRVSDREQAEKAHHEEYTQEQYDLVRQGKIKRIEDIPVELDNKDQVAMEKMITQGPTQVTDQKLWTELKLMSPAQLAQVKPYDHEGSLKENDYNSLLNMVRDARSGKNANLTSVQGVTSKATNALKSINIDVGDPEGQEFMRWFQDEVSALEKQNDNKKATPKEIDAIIDQGLIEGEVRGRVYDPDKRFFEVGGDERFFIEDVPESDRLMIIDFLERKNLPITDESIEDWYTRKVLNGR